MADILQLYRSIGVAKDIEAAKSAMDKNKQGKDGEILICRYEDSQGNPKALLGISNHIDGEKATLTYIEGVNITEDSTVSDAVQAAINDAIGKLNYAGQVIDGAFVTSVSEDNGVISVEQEKLTSNDESIKIDAYDLGVNIDNATIVQDANKALSVQISNDSESYLSADDTGIKLSGIADAINAGGAETSAAYNMANSAYDLAEDAYNKANSAYNLADSKQDALKAGVGIEITTDNIINVTLDTTIAKVVDHLPEEPDEEDKNKIFLVKSSLGGEEGNLYYEYLWIGEWEEIGEYRAEIDLTNYLTITNAAATYATISNVSEIGNNANSAYSKANSASDQANSANTIATSAYTTATLAYTQVNSAFTVANNAYNKANDAYNQANSANTLAQQAYNQANSAYSQANSAYDQANSAYTLASNAVASITASGTSPLTLSATKSGNAVTITGSVNLANYATASDLSNAYNQANAANTLAGTANTTASSAYNQANAAYNAANDKLPLAGGTMTGNIVLGTSQGRIFPNGAIKLDSGIILY